MTSPTTPAERGRARRYLCLVRQSDDSYGTTSTQAQLSLLKAEGEKRGWAHVDDIVLNGVTGSLPGKRDDLRGILERKRTRDDFDVLLVQRLDRLTRGGSDHGIWFTYEAERLGVEVVIVADDLPEGAYRNMIAAAKLDAAQEQAKSIGQRSVQGWVHSLQAGLNCVSSRPPFGCDRLYLSSEGEPLFVIRNLDDGRQQKLHPETGETIDVYGAVGGGAAGHYRKQRTERPTLCPGAPEKVETVRLIFELRYASNWRGKRIADQLNRRGLRSPTGKPWGQRQVESIYENPSYCGFALGMRSSQGIYYRRGGTGPEAINLPREVLATCRSAPKQLRPPEDWVWQEQPMMMEFLPEPLRDKALGEIRKVLMERYERSIEPDRPKRSTNRHLDSDYVLTGLLFARQDGERLSGWKTGKAGKRKRKYRHLRGQRDYQKGSIFNNNIDADALEAAVFALIADAARDAPEVRRRIEVALQEGAEQGDVEKELADLQVRREAVDRQTRSLYSAHPDDREAVEPLLAQLRVQRRELDEEIAKKKHSLRHIAIDPDEVVARLNERMKAMTAADIAALPPAARRELVAAFVERVEVDMATRDAEVRLKLPPWALESASGPSGEGRLVPPSPSPTSYETTPAADVRSLICLAWADCGYEHVQGSKKPVCYHCQRRAA